MHVIIVVRNAKVASVRSAQKENVARELLKEAENLLERPPHHYEVDSVIDNHCLEGVSGRDGVWSVSAHDVPPSADSSEEDV